MARPEARARIIEDAITEVNMKVNNDGSVNVVQISSNLESALEIFLTSYEGVMSTAEVPVLLLRNPSASTKYIFLDNIVLSAVTGGRIFWLRGYRSPTVTDVGTLIPTYNGTIQASAPVANLLVSHTPTVTDNGDKNFVLTSGQFQLSMPIGLNPITVLYPNQSFLITAISSGNNSTFAADLRWRELT